MLYCSCQATAVSEVQQELLVLDSSRMWVGSRWRIMTPKWHSGFQITSWPTVLDVSKNSGWSDGNTIAGNDDSSLQNFCEHWSLLVLFPKTAQSWDSSPQWWSDSSTATQPSESSSVVFGSFKKLSDCRLSHSAAHWRVLTCCHWIGEWLLCRCCSRRCRRNWHPTVVGVHRRTFALQLAVCRRHWSAGRSEEIFQKLIERLQGTAAWYGMEISSGKNKILVNSIKSRPSTNVWMNGKTLKKWTSSNT